MSKNPRVITTSSNSLELWVKSGRNLMLRKKNIIRKSMILDPGKELNLFRSIICSPRNIRISVGTVYTSRRDLESWRGRILSLRKIKSIGWHQSIGKIYLLLKNRNTSKRQGFSTSKDISPRRIEKKRLRSTRKNLENSRKKSKKKNRKSGENMEYKMQKKSELNKAKRKQKKEERKKRKKKGN